jgi:MFS family permease
VFLLALLTLCVASVPLAGGRIGRLSNIEFQRPWAGMAALILQYAIMRAFPEGDATLHAGLHLVSYGLMFYFLAANLSLPGLWLIGLGGACNALAIAANNGVMPALPSALQTAGIIQVPGEFANSTAVADAKLQFLGDVFALPAGAPMANVFSIGDILLLVGAFVLLHRVSNSRLAPRIVRLARWMEHTGPRLELVREFRAFRRLWIAQGISAVGDWVYPLAVFTEVVKDGGAKASSLAFLLIAQVGPGMLVGVFGGPLIDRFSRKWLMFLTDLVRGLAVATLLLSGDPSLVHLYVVAVVLGVGTALNQPAFQAALPNILPSRHLASANALVGLTMSFAVTVGPLLGALIVNEFGITWGFSANAVSFLFAAALVWGTDMPVKAALEAPQSIRRELAIGMRYVRGHREILAVVVVVGVITLAAGIKSPLEPLFALDSLDSGATGLGLLGAAWGLGMFLGAVVASPMDRRFGHGPLLTLSVIGVGFPVLIAAFMPSLWPVLLLWVVAGVANTLGTVAYETLLQEETPDAVRGRVFAAVEASLQAGLLLGVGGAALSETIFTGDVARLGMAAAGVLFIVAAGFSWLLLQRRQNREASARESLPAFDIRAVRVIEGGPSLALLRVSTVGVNGTRPVLLLDDGTRVHRIDALPGLNGGSFGYGVPKALLNLRTSALALEVGDTGLFDLPLPR